MKVMLLASCATIALLSSATFADDWEGMYIGSGTGLVMETGQFDLRELYDDEGYAQPLRIDEVHGSGPAASVYAGVNFLQSNSGSAVPFIFGVEGDLSYLGGEPRAAEQYIDTYYEGILKNNVDFMATLRGRVGVPVGPGLMYATAGIAAAQIESEYSVQEKDVFFSDSDLKFGIAFGAGTEYKITDNITLRGEIIAAQFEGDSAVDQLAYFDSDVKAHFDKTRVVMSRVGVSFKW